MTTRQKYAAAINAAESVRDLLNSLCVERSSRAWSRDLHWPRSLIPEVVAGKRKLTPERAVQLSQRLNASVLESEKILLMTLKDAAKGKARRWLEQQDAWRRLRTNADGADEEFYALPMLIRVICGHYHRYINFGDFQRKALRIDGVTRAIFDRYKAMLIANDAASRSGGFHRIVKPESTDRELAVTRIHATYVEQLRAYLCDSAAKPRILASGCYTLTDASFARFREKMLELLNAVNEESKAAPGDQPVRVYQFDLNAFPLTEEL